MAETNRLGYGCHIGVGRGLSVDIDGSVIPCNSFSHCPITSLFQDGELKYSPEQFLALWQQNETVLSLRREANVRRSNICTDCDLWELCNCGCPLTWGVFHPEDYINDGLLGISAETIYKWTVNKYNP